MSDEPHPKPSDESDSHPSRFGCPALLGRVAVQRADQDPGRLLSDRIAVQPAKRFRYSEGDIPRWRMNAGRRPYPPVLDENRIRLDANRGKGIRQSRTIPPMRRGALAVEYSAPGQHERAEAHRGNPPRLRQGLANPFHQGRVLAQLPYARAARNNESIDLVRPDA